MGKYTSKYTYRDVSCGDCANQKDTKYGTCGFRLCPYIMENLTDLFEDGKFRTAVKYAENCTTNHRKTLRHLKKNRIDGGYDIFDYKRPRHDYKPDCKTCNYGAVGFICHNSRDKTCLKDWLKMVQNGGFFNDS